MEIGERLRKIRTEQGVTQAALAKRIGVSSQVISNWERGYTPSIDHEDLTKLATALNVPIGQLIGHPEFTKLTIGNKSYTYRQLEEKIRLADMMEKMLNEMKKPED